ncbi:MAG: S1 RNA-binding domain-containing protein [Lachnospiraceae bacterium]|nr:S1 RNA-binding domain-containing protein [Lachnospiraceae bacterium]MDY5869472.1 S1-like domain-containing RNA-binding protein [Lachnospiraceae bacterium]
MQLGKRQELKIVKRVEFGVYLADTDNAEERVLLPGKEVPEGTQIGDVISVFIYRDSKDRLISTTREPLISVGQTALLRVTDVGKYGAFLDWNLEKDLLLPFKEQTTQLKPGDKCLVALYIDKSNRLCTTMKVYRYLRTDSPYQKNDMVEGVVYEINEKFGVFVAVDDCYSGLIPAREPAQGIRVSDRLKMRVADVLEDGKLTLSIRDKAYIQMNKDADEIMKLIERKGGKLSFNDKADPELIRCETGMSKNEFKRAVGNLYKQRLIMIETDGIRKI